MRTVWILRDGTPHKATVKAGASDGTVTELVEGDLREGDQVITDALGQGDTRAQQPPAQGPGMRRIF